MVLAHFGPFFPILGQKKIYSESSVMQNFKWVPSTMPMIQFLENALTEGRKDGQTLFYRTLPVTAGGPKTDWHEDKQLDTKKKKNLQKNKQCLSPRYIVSVLSTKCGGSHPKGLIVASLYKIRIMIAILLFTRQFSFLLDKKKNHMKLTKNLENM